MSPRLVPAARGGATGKALAVGAAQYSGGAEGARISAAGITSRPGEEASCDPRHKKAHARLFGPHPRTVRFALHYGHPAALPRSAVEGQWETSLCSGSREQMMHAMLGHAAPLAVNQEPRLLSS
jgi:hypothetical protein